MKCFLSSYLIDIENFNEFIKLRENHYPNGSKVNFILDNEVIICDVNKNNGLIETENYYKNDSLYQVKEYCMLDDNTRVLQKEKMYKNNFLHSYNHNPAFIFYDVESYCENGKKILPIQLARWYKNGDLHRETYPADIYYDNKRNIIEEGYYLYGERFDMNNELKSFDFYVLSNTEGLTKKMIREKYRRIIYDWW